MEVVELRYVITYPQADIEQVMTPKSIINFQATFKCDSIEEREDTSIATVIYDKKSQSIQMKLEFTEIENGYKYEKIGGDLFEELSTEIIVEEKDNTIITVRSRYTFGGYLAFIKDKLAISSRQRELDRFLTNLVNHLAEEQET